MPPPVAGRRFHLHDPSSFQNVAGAARPRLLGEIHSGKGILVKRLDFNQWAVVGLNDDTGLGRMANDSRKVLGIGFQLVVESDRLETKPLLPDRDRKLSPQASDQEVQELLQGIQGLLILERTYHPRLLAIAKSLGIPTVCVPMWEWFQPKDERWKDCSFFACPTRYTHQLLKGFGFENSEHLPWPLDLTCLPERNIEGPARLFLHNAGIVNPDDRKGTRETIRAFMKAKVPGAQLLVRLQKEVPLPSHDSRVIIEIGNKTAVSELYGTGEVAIQPSKMEGLGFMILEPACCGLPVITLDYPPMNEVVRQKELLVQPRWFRRKAFPTQWVRHAHLRLPRIHSIASAIEWCARHDLSEISRNNLKLVRGLHDRNHLLGLWAKRLEKTFF